MTNGFSDQIFEHSPNAYMVVDQELRYVAANAAYRRATATELGALLGKTFYEVFPHDADDPNNANVRVVRESLERVFETGEVDVIASVVYRVPEHTEAGVVTNERVWSVTHTPLRDVRGCVTHVLEHAVEITEVYRLRMAPQVGGQGERSDSITAEVMRRADTLQERYNLLTGEVGELRQLFDQTPGFVCFLRGPTHVFELANPAYYELVGRRELLGRPVREVLSDVDGQGYFQLLDRVYETAEPFVAHAMRVVLRRNPDTGAEERFVDFVFQPIVDAAGKSIGIFVSGNDVTEFQDASRGQREAVAHARAARAEQRFLADFLPVQVWTSDPDGALIYVSRQVAAYFGLSAEQIVGEGWKNVVHPDDLPAVVERWTHSLSTGKPYEVEFRLKRGEDGAYRWHLGRAVALRGDEGDIVKWYGTNADIHDQKAALQERETLVDALRVKNEELDRFAYVASHDLKAPLRAIANLSQWIVEDLRELAPPKTKEHLELLTQRAKTMSDLVDAFLQVAKSGLSREALSEVDTRAVCEHAVALIEPPAHVEVRLGDALPSIVAPRTALSQVFMNLISNAIAHAGERQLLIQIDAERDAQGHRFHVRDNGDGIPKAQRARLWDVFRAVRGPSSGTGLGLAIVKRTIEAHGGAIEVSETPGGGATFSFTWPAIPRAQA